MTLRSSNMVIGIFAVSIALVLIMGSFFFFPVWNAWRMGVSGQAALNYAGHQRKVQIEQAKAEKEAAQYRADAIAIVGGAAKEFPEYRYQEFLGAFAEALQNGEIDKLIFVPTEANIPITEAGRSVERNP